MHAVACPQGILQGNVAQNVMYCAGASGTATAQQLLAKPVQPMPATGSHPLACCKANMMISPDVTRVTRALKPC